MPPENQLATSAVEIRRSASRHRTRIGWLDGRHSFDTGIDPLGQDTHHGLLVVHNHDSIALQSGFDTHPHRDMEVVTWVLDGTLVHQDSEGNSGAIYPNLAQRMTAGSGIWHSEKNDRAGATVPVDLVQMWVVPDETGARPGYQQLSIDPSDLNGQLAVIASGIPKHRNDAAIHIRNRWAALHVGRLQPGQTVTVPGAPYVHVYLARGSAQLEEAEALDTGDAARLTDAGPRRLQATEPSEVLIWEMRATL